MPTLVDLSVRDVATAMRAWSDCATAHRDPTPEAPHRLHLSRTLAGRWRLDANLGAETGELLAAALRIAQAPEADDEPARSAATRRADALGDVCRFFLDHQRTRRAGRHRPHINLVLDVERYRALATTGATTVDGTSLDRTTVERLLCDAALHRVLTQGRSAILDYGAAARTIPAPLFNALVVHDRRCRFPGWDRPAAWVEDATSGRGDKAGPRSWRTSCCCVPEHHHLLHSPAGTAEACPSPPSRSPTSWARPQRLATTPPARPTHLPSRVTCRTHLRPPRRSAGELGAAEPFGRISNDPLNDGQGRIDGVDQPHGFARLGENVSVSPASSARHADAAGLGVAVAQLASSSGPPSRQPVRSMRASAPGQHGRAGDIG